MKRSAVLVAIIAIAGALSACAQLAPTPNQPEVRVSAIADAQCHLAPDADQVQYIVGYGSLMQDESRKRTSRQAGPAHPVEVTGYQRGWFAKGDPLGFSTTYLGVAPDPGAHVNAVIYRVEANELMATDRREASYCRSRVPLTEIKTLEGGAFRIESGQAWIYVNRPESIAVPSARFPIVQSYVDIFVSGCLEQEQRFELNGFAQQCLANTRYWSDHWVNDRLYPRRPFIHQPKARQIDALLNKYLPDYFSRIRIE